ncbi:hypothetical protein [Leptospira interrogans]|uniref:hypothetical protein n=1 Tax=Leptospira interrogans TaxID=173 RepID=UPI000773ACC1|nr:hypothetical protein [Leptospira interrogans]
MSEITDKFDDFFGKLSLAKRIKLMQHIKMKFKLQSHDEGVNAGPSYERDFRKGLNTGPFNQQSNSTKICPACKKPI